MGQPLAARTVSASQPWSLEDSLELYNVPAWGSGYFSINSLGHVVVRPDTTEMCIRDRDRSPGDRGRVFFGARVTLEDANGVRRVYRIVGPDEFDMGADYISMDSPLGRALLGRRLADEFTLELERGTQQLRILAIDYG